MSTPKGEELVATPYRHGSKEKAEEFFLQGMTKAMERLAEQALPSFPVTIYYAFKQSGNEENGTSSTGWETFLGALIRAGFSITGTWPVRTEYTGNLKKEVSALASSIVLVCRKRAHDAPQATRRDFIAALKKELPPALRILQSGNIAPVDLAQAAIGPGMGIFTRYSRVLDAHGNILSVREALSLINEILDETLSEQEGEYDEVTRWSLTWFEQHGFSEGEFGDADTLSKARNVVVHELVDIGIVESRRGKVRLLPPEELPPNWEPEKKGSLTAWEVVHHLARALENGGEMAASELIKKCSNRAETAKDLSYRLYNICERKKWASEAFTYNALVQSWPEIVRLSRAEDGNQDGQGRLFSESEE
jgi:putative DNA methylase